MNQLVEFEDNLEVCPNCEREHDVEYEFCPYCGQKTDEEVTLGNLFYNTITNYFSFDARFFKSFIPLLFRPGYLPKKFVEGKRLLYLHPAQMYLFVSVLFFFLFSFIEREQAAEFDKALKKQDSKISVSIGDSSKITPRKIPVIDSITKELKENPEKFGMSEEEGKELDSIIRRGTLKNKGNNFNIWNFNFNEAKVDSLLDAGVSDKEIVKTWGVTEESNYLERKFSYQILKFYKNKDGASILHTLYDAIPIAMFILLPIFSLLIYIFYFNKGRFAHHLIFSFYYFSFLFALFSIMTGINLIWDVPDWIDSLLIFSTFFYFMMSLKRYYGQGWFLTIFKSFSLTFLFMMIVLPLSAGLVIAYAFLFF